MMVIAGFSSIVGPKEPLPGPLERERMPKHGIHPLAGVYAKQGLERQDIVRFLPGFRPKEEGRNCCASAGQDLDRLK
ncbi:hypothetical protein [Mesorhizobium hawassense]|uniref:hypothetical protein n=1 Tax=Mesorhizobium hawassense TaxID=1209954 RepID=UPI0011BEAB0E|nr:hypothetical protein [Mesorhizobium hawassense]